MFQSLIDAISSLVFQAAPLQLRRTHREYITADPPMTREEAIQWLWGDSGVSPPLEQFRADPEIEPKGGPQRKFYFKVPKEDILKARKDFVNRYYAYGPDGHWLQQLPAWVPEHILDELVQLEMEGRFAKKYIPFVKRYKGESPWGDIVAYYGGDEFGDLSVQVYQYYPEDLEFYVNLVDSNQRGGLIHTAYTSYNRDMQYFVEERKMAPDVARNEIRRINEQVFKLVLEASASILDTGGALSGIKTIMDSADDLAERVLNSYQAKRRALGLSDRKKLGAMIIFRGTTHRLKSGDSAYTHDLGPGTYFTTSEEIAQFYATIRGTADDPKIILKVLVEDKELGRVLDLINGPHSKLWNEQVEEWVKSSGYSKERVVNEIYYKLFADFLQKLGYDIKKLEKSFDAIIGHEYVRNTVQINIINKDILDKILMRAEELYQ